MDLEQARTKLLDAASQWVEDDDGPSQEQLCRAAVAYAETRSKLARGTKQEGRATGGSGPRFGRSQGKTWSELELADLQWYAGAIKRSIDDPARERFREKNEAELADVLAEIGRR